jgi:hypothetical protein
VAEANSGVSTQDNSLSAIGMRDASFPARKTLNYRCDRTLYSPPAETARLEGRQVSDRNATIVHGIVPAGSQSRQEASFPAIRILETKLGPLPWLWRLQRHCDKETQNEAWNAAGKTEE